MSCSNCGAEDNSFPYVLCKTCYYTPEVHKRIREQRPAITSEPIVTARQAPLLIPEIDLILDDDIGCQARRAKAIAEAQMVEDACLVVSAYGQSMIGPEVYRRFKSIELLNNLHFQYAISRTPTTEDEYQRSLIESIKEKFKREGYVSSE